MSILQKQNAARSARGLRARLHHADGRRASRRARRRGVRVVANAGGVNPRGCADALARDGARRTRITIKLRVGVVTGDDLLPRLDELIAAGHELANMETGAPLSSVRDRVLSANAYVGAPPIIEALGRGANVVVTGRCTDTALILAPLMHEFGWPANDWNRLAVGYRRRTHRRVRRAVDRRQLRLRLEHDPRSRERRLPDRRGRGGRIVRRHEASGHRRPRRRARRDRAARVRDGRPEGSTSLPT